MLKGIIPLTLAYALAATVAQAQIHHSYTLIYASDHLSVFADFQAIAPSGNYLKAWTLWVNYPDLNDTGKGKYAYRLDQDLYSCGANQSALTDLIAYSVDGNTVDSATHQYPAFDDIVPGSIGEFVFTDICNRRSHLKDATIFSDIGTAVSVSRLVMSMPMPKAEKK